MVDFGNREKGFENLTRREHRACMNKGRKEFLSPAPLMGIQGFKRGDSEKVKAGPGLTYSFLKNKTEKGITAEKGGANHG